MYDGHINLLLGEYMDKGEDSTNGVGGISPTLVTDHSITIITLHQ